jgi:hypothetical protein
VGNGAHYAAVRADRDTAQERFSLQNHCGKLGSKRVQGFYGQSGRGTNWRYVFDSWSPKSMTDWSAKCE